MMKIAILVVCALLVGASVLFVLIPEDGAVGFVAFGGRHVFVSRTGLALDVDMGTVETESMDSMDSIDWAVKLLCISSISPIVLHIDTGDDSPQVSVRRAVGGFSLVLDARDSDQVEAIRAFFEARGLQISTAHGSSDDQTQAGRILSYGLDACEGGSATLIKDLLSEVCGVGEVNDDDITLIEGNRVRAIERP